MIIESLDKDTQQRILAYLDLVIEKNNELNLTRIDTKDKGITLHIEDSLSCLDEFIQDDGQFLDLGTGGGFPGVPLGLASGRKGVLIDSVQKKARAVEELVDKIGASEQFEVLGIRSEDLARERPRSFSTVVARAVSSLPVLLELSSPLLERGGHLIALRGVENTNTIEQAKSVASKVGMELMSQRNLKIDDEYKRTILVFEKTSDSTIQLPRRNGMAQKRPLN